MYIHNFFLVIYFLYRMSQKTWDYLFCSRCRGLFVYTIMTIVLQLMFEILDRDLACFHLTNWLRKELSFVTNSNFLITISFKSGGANLDISNYTMWNYIVKNKVFIGLKRYFLWFTMERINYKIIMTLFLSFSFLKGTDPQCKVVKLSMQFCGQIF